MVSPNKKREEKKKPHHPERLDYVRDINPDNAVKFRVVTKRIKGPSPLTFDVRDPSRSAATRALIALIDPFALSTGIFCFNPLFFFDPGEDDEKTYPHNNFVRTYSSNKPLVQQATLTVARDWITSCVCVPYGSHDGGVRLLGRPGGAQRQRNQMVPAVGALAQ